MQRIVEVDSSDSEESDGNEESVDTSDECVCCITYHSQLISRKTRKKIELLIQKGISIVCVCGVCMWRVFV